MNPLSVVTCLVVLIWLATDCNAQEIGLPDIAVVNRNDEGAIVGIRLAAKSNRERLTLATETIDSLAKLTELESLSLWGTTVGDEDLRKLISLKELRTIDLSHTDVTGASLQTLSKLENLVSVRLDSCDVTDQHLAELESMPQLAMLPDAVESAGVGKKEAEAWPYESDLVLGPLCWIYCEVSSS